MSLKIATAITISLISIAGFSAEPAKQNSKASASFEEEWQKAFRKADKDGSGGLSKAELKNAAGFPGIKKYFKRMDTNKDREVSISERNTFFANKRKQKQRASSK